jgi:hypothetical protein
VCSARADSGAGAVSTWLSTGPVSCAVASAGSGIPGATGRTRDSTARVVGGAANLASMSISQTVVQLRAPAADRGRVIGLYGVSANGLRAGSGFGVGLAGAAIGVHWSLGASAAALCAGTVVGGVHALRGTRTAAPAAA